MLKETSGVKNGELSHSSPVFIVGIPRSGTSLLYALLNRHPEVALMYECEVWSFPESLCGMRFRGDWLRRQEFYNQALSRHRLIFGGSLRGLEQVQTPGDLYRVFSESKDKLLFGEKSPFYCARLQWLAQRHPGCRFVLLWRDPIEIYRSVVRAGREEPFFRRRGMQSRIIFYGEQMIRQATRLEQAGVPLCHVTYADLTGDTENTCRRICRFLGIEFEVEMLDLAGADLSAIFPGPEHNHLRSGRIGRQNFSNEAGIEIIGPAARQRLQRFGARWRRLQSRWHGQPTAVAAEAEPSVVERLYCRMTGTFFQALDDGKRALFEFLPLPWLQTYRLLKESFLLRRVEKQLSLRELLSTHGITILTSYAILACVVAADYSTGPEVTMAPFYMIPSVILTLIVGRRWGIFATVLAVIFWSAIQSLELKGSVELGIVAWNSIMRFLVFLTVVLLLDRIRVVVKMTSPTCKSDM